MFFMYIMQIKNKILFIFKVFKIWIEKQTEKQIKRIWINDELRSNVFNNWFEKTNIQWKSFASNTFEQNDVIKRKIYIIVNSIKVIHKIYSILMKLWNFIIEKIVYIWNKIVTTLFCRSKITSFKMINKIKLNVSNLRTLNCCYYVYVLKINEKHKFNDRFWKEVLIDYENRNQWKIYNFLNKKLHISRDVRFDEKKSYYETNLSSSQCIIKKSKEEEKEMKHIWIESENEKMSEAQRLFTASKNKYFTSSNIKDFVDINEKKKFKNINERQLTSEQQKKFISREIMLLSFQSISSRTIFIEKSISIKQTNVLNSSTFIKK